LIIAASPRVAVLSVISGLIPRHVITPFIVLAAYPCDFPLWRHWLRLCSRLADQVKRVAVGKYVN